MKIIKQMHYMGKEKRMSKKGNEYNIIKLYEPESGEYIETLTDTDIVGLDIYDKVNAEIELNMKYKTLKLLRLEKWK